MVKIYIDPGHGGTDPGATANGLREKDLTLKIAKHIQDYLKGYNCSVKMSRTNDKTLSLAQRTNDANRWGADFFLSIHINAGGGTGYEDYIYNGVSNESKSAKIRNVVHDEVSKVVSNYGVVNRGKKKANFHVLRESEMPAMLSETLFIDTSKDAKLLKDNKFLKDIGQAHAKGIVKAFGLKKVGATKPKANVSKPSKSSKSSKKQTSNYTGDSIVDYLKAIGQPSSFAHRKKLAKQYGIKNYTGTASQNTKLLNALRGNKTNTKATSTKKYTPRTFKVGQKVKIKSSAKKYSRSNVTIPAKYKNKPMTIQQVGKDDVLIKELYSWVKKTDVK